MHANWLYVVELRHEVPGKAPSRISEEAVMMAIACNPSYCRGRAGGALGCVPQSYPAMSKEGSSEQEYPPGIGSELALRPCEPSSLPDNWVSL